MTAIDRAKLALEGLSVDDAFGQKFFIDEDSVAKMVALRELPSSPWYLTDDSIMSLAVFDTLQTSGQIDPDALASEFAKNYTKNPRRGYGGMAHHILQAFVRGDDWRVVAPRVFDGSGSFGNGAAMRVAPQCESHR
jgi:ADP-ribosylglycohydrolase